MFWPSVFDPVGMVLFRNITRYWTPSEQNTLWLPFTGMFLWNRVVWFAVGVLALIACYVFFPMSAEALTARRSKKLKRTSRNPPHRPHRSFITCCLKFPRGFHSGQECSSSSR